MGCACVNCTNNKHNNCPPQQCTNHVRFSTNDTTMQLQNPKANTHTQRNMQTPNANNRTRSPKLRTQTIEHAHQKSKTQTIEHARQNSKRKQSNPQNKQQHI